MDQEPSVTTGKMPAVEAAFAAKQIGSLLASPRGLAHLFPGLVSKRCAKGVPRKPRS